MKKLISVCILFFSVLFLSACSEDRSFTIDDVTIDSQIDEAGIMHVRELYTYTFDGTYEGMTRSIKSDVHDFKAYVTGESDPLVATDNLHALKTEESDDELKIFTDSKNETKKVLYSYNVEGSVKKYKDVGELEYAFFDEANETDLHHVTISVHPPLGASPDELHSYLHKDETGALSAEAGGVFYENELLKAGKDSTIRLLFPAEQLSGMRFDKQKEMETNILEEEQELANRQANLEENMAKPVPFTWIMIVAVIVVAIFMLITHPNRYRGDKSVDALRKLLEQTDPLFVKYMLQGEYLSNDSFIAALFSLKQRGFVKMEKVPSVINDKDSTFRFTRISNESKLDKADKYLVNWLFTMHDDQGDYFLLESLLDNEKESETVKKEKAEYFEKHLQSWSEMVKERKDYQRLRHAYKGFSFYSVPLIILTYGLFYYFTTIDPISQTEQWVMPTVLGFLAVISLLFNRNKWVLSVYYVVALFMAGIGFTLTNTVILTLVFNGISLLAMLIVPSYYRDSYLKRLKYAMKIASDMFKQGHYPIGSDPDKVEQRIAYAIILGEGEAYGEQCGTEEKIAKLKSYYPLLNNPVYATSAFSTTNLALYATVVQSSSTSSTSATGGGGAGAF